MAEIKSLARIREKWQRVTPGRTEDYKIGIKNPKRTWSTEAKAGKGNWKLGVDAAHMKDLFAKGIDKAGDTKWEGMALKKGPTRFMEGVTIGGPYYEDGFKPYHDAIERVDLGPKFPRRDPRNLDRVRRVVEALVAEKVG